MSSATSSTLFRWTLLPSSLRLPLDEQEDAQCDTSSDHGAVEQRTSSGCPSATATSSASTMKSDRFGWLLGILLCSPPSASAGEAALPVDAVRQALREAQAGRLPRGSVLLEAPLIGYEFHQELRQPSGTNVFVVAARAGGGILGY